LPVPRGSGAEISKGDRTMKLPETFFSSPSALIWKMKAKIQGSPKRIIDPSAGDGAILDLLKSLDSFKRRDIDFKCIEIDSNLQSILRGKGYAVIDQDFLNFSGHDKFDLIIMNPPFDNGDDHLLKAIEIMYRGQIICVLNAETIKNPYSNKRKKLLKTLTNLNADIEYIKNAFVNADRKTSVEIALITININNSVEEIIFEGCVDSKNTVIDEIKETYEVSTKKSIEELVAEYNRTATTCIDTIMNYYKNYKIVEKFIWLNEPADSIRPSINDMTGLVQEQVNDVLRKIRKHFWIRTLTLEDVRKRMTQSRLKEFDEKISQQQLMDFTEINIRTFILNLIHNYEDTLTIATIEIFDKFTKASYRDTLYEENILHFNGWKTNEAFKVGPKVIQTAYGTMNGPFIGWTNQWSCNLSCSSERFFDDIDKVMNYFDNSGEYYSIIQALKDNLNNGISKKIESTYFIIDVFKKGTIHLQFKDKNILRRFNLAACIGKNWLPDDYGKKAYSQMNQEEKNVVNQFDGEKIYERNLNLPVFPPKTNMLQLAA